METKLNNKTSELEVIIAAEKSEWKKVQRETENKLIQNLSIKGFRKGKVPVDIAKQHIAGSQIMHEAVSKIIESLAKKAATAIDKNTIILSGPSYAVNKISNVELEIKFIYPIFPNFKIGKYKGLDFKFNPKKIDDQIVNEEINKIRSSQIMLKDKKGTIAKGDVAIFDFEGFVDGKTFEGGKGEKFQLEIGSGKFIPGFENQMIGLKHQDKKDVEVTFPQDYHDKNLRGKKAIFKILIHEIKIKETPELNNEFVKTSGVSNVESVDELKKYIKKVFEEQSYHEASTKFQREAFDEILKETKNLVVPSILIDQEIQSLKKRMLENLKQQNFEFKQYLKMAKITEEQFNSQLAQQANTRLKDAFIFGEIAKLENIEITEKEYDEEYKKLAKVYGKTVNQAKEMITKEQIQITITNKRVIDLLIKNKK